MMKRWLACLLILLLMATLAACADAPGGENSDDPSDTQTGDTFGITYQETKIALGQNAASVLEQLGTPNTSQEVFDCGAGNSRMYYRFASFELYVMKNADGKEVIDQIELNDDLTQTDEGIRIGSKESDLRAAYGDPATEKNGVLTYTRGSYRLIAEVENGTVTDLGLLRVTQ